MRLLLLQLLVILSSIIDAGAWSCTGQKSKRDYNPSREMCCNGEVELRNRSRRCCFGAAKFYDKATQVCCEDNVSSRLSSTKHFEDGSIQHDSSSGRCCGREFINSSKHLSCCHSSSPSQSIPYDHNTHVCCAGKTYPKTDTTDCCGDLLYQKNEQLCCNSQLFSHKYGIGQTQCCNQSVIDGSKQVCLMGQAHDTQCMTEHGPVPVSECCNEVYRFNPKTDKCCGREVVPKDVPCCRGVGMLPNQVCCSYGGPKNKTQPDMNACCENGKTHALYNRNTTACTAGKLERFELCGPTPYDPRRQLCCEGVVYNQRRPGHNESICCGSKFIKYRHFEFCCPNHEIKRSKIECDQRRR